MKSLVLQLPIIKQAPLTRTAVVGSISITLMVISGSVYPVFGKQLTTAFSPLSLLFISEMMGGLFVLMSFGLLPLVRKVKTLNRSHCHSLVAMGILSGVISPYLWFKGLLHTTAVNAELFSRSEMIFMIFLSVIILHEKISKKQILPLIVILAGVLFVALKGFTVGIDMGKGDVLIVLSAVTYAFGSVIVKKNLNDVHPELIILARAGCATAFFVCVSPFVTHNLITELSTMPSNLFVALLAYGFIAKFLGIYSFHEAIETLKVSTVSIFSTLSIIGGITFAALYLGEQIHQYHIIGTVFIVLGVIMMQRAGLHANKAVHEHHIRQHHRNNL